MSAVERFCPRCVKIYPATQRICPSHKSVSLLPVYAEEPSLPILNEQPSTNSEHPGEVECIAVVEHLNFCLGNAMNHIWQAGRESSGIHDLQKARWYIDREILRRGSMR